MNKKKNNGGFTIVELICIIGILIVIIGIFSLNAIYSQKKNKDEQKDTVIAQVMSAADAYVSANKDAIKNLYEGYGYIDVPIGDLREAGLLDEELIDPETGEIIPDDEVVRIKLETGDVLDFIYPVNDNQEAWVLVAEPLTIPHSDTINNWCSQESLVYSGLIRNPDDASYADYPSKLYLMNNNDKDTEKARMYRGDYFDANGINLKVESCNVNTKKEGTYNITYKFKDPDLNVEKKQNRTVYVAADSSDIISFDVASINDNNPIMQLLPENNIKIVIIEHLRGNATRTVTTTIGELNNKGYIITNFSTKEIALNNSKTAVVTSKRVNSDGSTPEAREKPYTVIPAKYDLYFDANGGSASKTKLTVEYNKAYNAYGSFPTASRTGYTFTGWYTSPYGGSKIEPSQIVDDPSIRTLYAQWRGNPYNVTFSGNGGTPSSSSSTVIFGSYYTIPTYTPTREGYDFMGWYTTPTYGSGTEVTNYTTVNTPSNHTVYAQWRGKPYTVLFDPNGGSPSGIKYTTQYFGSYYNLPYPSPTKSPGYYFDGWYTAPTGGSYISGSTIMRTASTHTLYAHYAEITYRLTYNANGGNVSPSSKIIKYSDGKLGTLPTPTRTGYKFLGWYTAQSEGTKVSSTTTISSDKTIYAHWEVNSYTVSFNANGGSPTPASKTIKYGSTYGTLSTPTKQYNTFKGWYTSASGGTRVTSTTTMNKATNHTLYAQWIPETVTIYFETNGGKMPSGWSTSKQYNKGTAYGSLPTPTKCGLSFKNWTKNGSVVSRYDKALSNATLTANYELTQSSCSNLNGCSNWLGLMRANGQQWSSAGSKKPWLHSCNVTIVKNKCRGGTEYSNGFFVSTPNCYNGSYVCFTTSGTWYYTKNKPTNDAECRKGNRLV